jgi:hypothetical protein
MVNVNPNNLSMQCIYYNDRQNLNFDSQEHVIPAAIGGRSKLPLEFVSREFNSDISKLEREVIQHSIVSLPREIEGPGKRGKLTARHETKSDVMILGDADDSSMFALGYVRKGIGYEIPQVIYDTDTGIGQVRVHSPAEVIEFKNGFGSVDVKRLRTIIDPSLPKNIIILGMQKGIEDHFDIFFAKNKENTVALTADIIFQLGEGIKTDSTGEREAYQPVFGKKIIFDINHFRIYGKIAFNYLAFKFGKDFALREEFNPVRKWIAGGGQNRFASLSSGEVNPFSMATSTLPEAYHLVFMGKVRNAIVARVVLYNGIGVKLVLAHNFPDDFNSQALLCDWKNQKEYELRDYLKLFYTKQL